MPVQANCRKINREQYIYISTARFSLTSYNNGGDRCLKFIGYRVYFSAQLITICAVVNLKCAPEKATCAVVICAVVKYLPK